MSHVLHTVKNDLHSRQHDKEPASRRKQAARSLNEPHDILWTTGNQGKVRMAKRNLTVELDDEVVRKAKIVAAKRGTSVSRLVAMEIEDLAEGDVRYEEARERALKALANAKPRGGRSWRREDLYQR